MNYIDKNFFLFRGFLKEDWTQRKQRKWATGSGVIVMIFVAIDGLIRAFGYDSEIAPDHATLWLGIVLGAGIGAIALAAAWLMPQSQREFVIEVSRMLPEERRQRRIVLRNLLYSGWQLVLMLGLIGWCWLHDVFVIPAIFAVNAVLFAALPPWALPINQPMIKSDADAKVIVEASENPYRYR